eukprot:scaffold115113_cov37-Attheya_sp.AAC.1
MLDRSDSGMARLRWVQREVCLCKRRHGAIATQCRRRQINIRHPGADQCVTPCVTPHSSRESSVTFYYSLSSCCGES